MKRFGVLILLIGLLTACSSNDTSEKAANNVDAADKKTTAVEQEEEQGIEVDKGLLNVEVTLPASFFEGEDVEEVIEDARADGVSEVRKNDDGSLTYKMSKSKHKEMLSEMKESIVEYIDELENDEDFPSIKEESYKKNFQEFTLTVDREAFENSFDGFALLGLGFTGMYYQVFEGGNLEKDKVLIHLQDASTGESFDSIVYPDALDE